MWLHCPAVASSPAVSHLFIFGLADLAFVLQKSRRGICDSYSEQTSVYREGARCFTSRSRSSLSTGGHQGALVLKLELALFYIDTE